MEWPPTDGSSLIRLVGLLVSSGVGAWLLRRFPARFGRWLSKRIHLEQENIDLMSENNSLRWSNARKDREIVRLETELEQIIEQVAESRARAERIDSLLGSDAPLPVPSRIDPTP